jgi:hypothetical protein
MILENLEIAETRYISSFRLTTPGPSIADLQPRPPPQEPDRPYISRPRALGGSVVRPSVSFINPYSSYALELPALLRPSHGPENRSGNRS